MQAHCEDQAVLELKKTVFALHDLKLMMQVAEYQPGKPLSVTSGLDQRGGEDPGQAEREGD